MQTVLDGSDFDGELLLENLWWPGSFRGDTAEEVSFVLESIPYPKTGIMVDTGHLLNTSRAIMTEEEGIDWIEERLKRWGNLKSAIRGVHLTKSLSADYAIETSSKYPSILNREPFSTRYRAAVDHVRRIDQHEAFGLQRTTRLFEQIDPVFVVYEFTYKSLSDWLAKIRCQRHAMAGVHHFGVSGGHRERYEVTR